MIGRDDVLGVVLAGGRARRLGGADKAFEPLAGRPLIARTLERFAPQVGAVAISANGDPARFAGYGVAVLPDPVAGGVGPLAGLAAGLLHAGRLAPRPRFVATVAVDTPFLPIDLVARLRAALPDDGRTLAVAATAGRIHPVAALHPVEEGVDLLAGLADGSVRRVMSWIEVRPHVVVEFPSAADGDPFANLNTAEDFAAAEARSAAAG